MAPLLNLAEAQMSQVLPSALEGVGLGGRQEDWSPEVKITRLHSLLE